MARPAAAEVARTVLAAVEATDGVAGTDTGPLGTWVTYGSGGRVPGVTVHDSDGGRTASVRMSLRWGPGLHLVADHARQAALAALEQTWPDGGPWSVDAEVTDVVTGDVVNGDVVNGDGGERSSEEPRSTPDHDAVSGGPGLPALEAGAPAPAALVEHVPESVPIDLGGAGSVTVPMDDGGQG